MENLIYKEVSTLIGVITFNRTSAHNALNHEMLIEFHNLLLELKSTVKILILTGSGNKAFIAGADIKEMNTLSDKEFSDFLLLGQEITNLIEDNQWVSIAAVNGYALGGGAEIALACDIIIASENAKFGLPEVKLGIIPGFGGTIRLGRKIPINKAKELIFTGEIISLELAYNYGLVNKCTSTENLLEEAIAFANLICRNSLSAVLSAKKTMNRSYYKNFNEDLDFERKLCTSCFQKQERIEGMTSFSEKRLPVFNK